MVLTIDSDAPQSVLDEVSSRIEASWIRAVTLS
jgi:hypothetical protein